MSHQNHKLPYTALPVFFLMSALSTVCFGTAHAADKYRCKPASKAHERIAVALDICKEMQEFHADPTSAASGDIREAFNKASDDEMAAHQLAMNLNFALPAVEKLGNEKRTALLEISAAVIGVGGAVIGGGLHLSNNKSVNRSGTWVGIVAGAIGGGIALSKGVHDWLVQDKETMDKVPGTVKRYILYQHPRFNFRIFRLHPEELNSYVDAMHSERMQIQLK